MSADRRQPPRTESAADTSCSYNGFARVRVAGLKVDFLDRPLGLDNSQPRLSWRLESDERGVRQTAYRILVASNKALIEKGHGDLWDSGKVTSSQSVSLQYAGASLVSRQRCWWSIQVWDDRNEPSSRSTPSWWEMGLLEKNDWSARWLAAEDSVAKADRQFGLSWIWGPDRNDARLRKFRLKFRLPVASLGGQLFAIPNELSARLAGIWIDGKPLAGLDSAPTGNWIELPALDAGEHVMAMEIAPLERGVFFSERAVRPQMLVAFARLNLKNGETLRIGSGTHCKTSTASETEWFSPTFNDTAWEAAHLVPAPLEDHHPWPAMPAVYLRRDFHLEKQVAHARLYVTALGGYEARINGCRVGNAVLTTELSQYAKRVLYQAHDVTDLIRQNANALGLLVGDGFYASYDRRFGWAPPPRRVLAQLEITFADGTQSIVATGSDWRTDVAPVSASDMKVGETYDARLEQPGWDTPAFDDTHWRAAELADAPNCRVAAQTSPPIRVTRLLKPLSITQPRPGTYVFDFGEHLAGWCRLRVHGERGARIEVRFAELLNPSGELDQARWNLGLPKKDVYLLKGAASEETFEPHFTYRGFRYAEVTGLTIAPDRDTLTACIAHTDLDLTGHLRIDDFQIDRIWANTVRTQRSNFMGIPTDCPSREQRGYLADVAIFWDAAAFNMDVCAFTARLMDCVQDDQAPDGAFPICAPSSRWFANYLPTGSTPAWSDGGVILPWTVWQRYADSALIERHWEAMNRYLQFILAHNPNHLWQNERGSDLGDWLSPQQLQLDPYVNPTTPLELIATAYWAYSATLLAQMAEATGRANDASRLYALVENIKRAFTDAYVQADGTVGNGSQTCYLLALKFELLPAPVRPLAIEKLVADIRSRGNSLTTGFLGTRFILDVLTDAGFSSIAYDLLLRTEYPSWGHMIRNGATTIWENWAGQLEVEGSLSRNHFAFGAVCGYLFRRIAGIDAAEPGFSVIKIHPVIDPRIKRAGADYESIIGRVSTDWAQQADGSFALDVTIPANATARVHLPASDECRIEENGTEIALRDGIINVQRLPQEAEIEIGSGSYSFTVEPSRQRQKKSEGRLQEFSPH